MPTTLAMALKRKCSDGETAAGAPPCASAAAASSAAPRPITCAPSATGSTSSASPAPRPPQRRRPVVFAAASSALPEKKAKTSVAVASSSDDAAAVELPSSLSVVTVEQPATAKPPAVANRCVTCRRKVGLTEFRCRCGGTFCGAHRYSEAHGCGFDYKSAGREQIARQNPLVVAGKITRI